MAHIVKISDEVLINNLYRILYNEFGEVKIFLWKWVLHLI
jgi:hypothetical protein